MFGVIRRYFVLSHTLGLLLSNEGKNIEIRGRNERTEWNGGGVLAVGRSGLAIDIDCRGEGEL